MPTLDLTPDRIVTVARGLISEHGLSDFSMRKLAAALDVNPMTIYLRFDNKDALLDAVARASLAEFKAPPADGTWSEQVRALAIGLRNHLIHDRETLRLLNDADRLSAGLLGTLAGAAQREDIQLDAAASVPAGGRGDGWETEVEEWRLRPRCTSRCEAPRRGPRTAGS